MNIIKEYQAWLKQAQWNVSAVQWIILSAFLGIAISTAAYFVITVSKLPISPLMALVVLFVVLDLMLGYPYFRAVRRINSIEEDLPNAFKQISDTLKAGGTFEFALREISTSMERTPLQEEATEILRKLEEGQNLENALKGFAENVNSRLVKRTVNIIIDSIESGAGLSDVLDKIADDVRETHKIVKERKATTLMQVLFLVAAGAIVAPFIFGLVSTIIDFLIISTSQGIRLTAEQIATAKNARDTIVNLLQSYIFIEVLACSAMIAVMREGRPVKSVLYIPILLLIAFLIYYASSLAIAGLLLGRH
ncbi:MAG: type II secretion system F family protein [Candidatus Diapherotrites archaeon]|nr:type II secretion system F family protein [Candidatus Diapherotrites archaeon]